MNEQTTKDATATQYAKLSDFKFAPVLSGTPLWITSGHLIKEEGIAYPSKSSDSIYIKLHDGTYVSHGKAYDIIQQIPEGTTITVVCQIMDPNPDVSQDTIDYITEKHGAGSLKKWQEALEKGYKNCRFMREVA